MAHELRFLAMDLPNRSWSELLRRYRHIEDLGFDLAGVADHFVLRFEAWTLLAAIARETSTVRLATWMTQIPLRNPALLAHQACTVDHLSDGRLELGLGVGLIGDPSYAMMGLPNWSYRERVTRFKEYVEIVDRVLSNEVTTYKGQYYEINAAVMNPRPVQRPRPPIIIAAMGPVMLKRAAELADNWNSVSFAGTFEGQIEEMRDRTRLIDEHCAAIGRDPASLRRSFLMSIRSATERNGLFEHYESPEIFADMIQRLINLGISEIGIWYPMRDEQLPIFEKIATEVIPELKAKHAARLLR